MPDRVALFLPSLRIGGAERAMLNLACGFADAGLSVDLVTATKEGGFADRLPSDIRVFDLKAPRMRSAVFGLANYLRRERPAALLSRMNHANVAALVARRIARVETRVVVIEASNLTAMRATGTLNPLVPLVMRFVYPWADEIVAVSDGVARDLAAHLSCSPKRVQTIYNPLADEVFTESKRDKLEHPWLADKSVPNFVSIGRLHVAKDFPTLLRAFQRVRQDRPARLLIFGDGEERQRLEQLVKELNLCDDVALPGFTSQPYNVLRHASTFVLSSCFEGFPNVLLESLGCGCPVVSTDCPSGPREVLDHGRYGALVPVGDAASLAQAMLQSLDRPHHLQQLRSRAAEFAMDRILPQYLAALGISAPHHRRQRVA